MLVLQKPPYFDSVAEKSGNTETICKQIFCNVEKMYENVVEFQE